MSTKKHCETIIIRTVNHYVDYLDNLEEVFCYFHYYVSHWGTNTFLVDVFIQLCLTFDESVIVRFYRQMCLSARMVDYLEYTLHQLFNQSLDDCLNNSESILRTICYLQNITR